MRRAWHAWVALWDRREAPTALALARIFLGLAMFLDLMHLAWLGMVTPLFARPPDGFAATYDGWAGALLGTGPEAAVTLWLVATVAAACVALGCATRVACVVFVVVTAQLGYIAPGADRGIHMIARVSISILALSSCHAQWSVDAWIRARRGRPFPREVPAWPRYLLLLQLVWIYFSAGHNKAADEWGPAGSFMALPNALTDPHFARFDPAWVVVVLPALRLGTIATMAFELSAPLYVLWLYYAETAKRGGRLRWLCNRLRLRWVWIGLGISFHLGIAVFLRIGVFPWGMLALYPVLLRPAELARWSPAGARSSDTSSE
ncbi:MAG: HTTM domain-containing protein [Kofleriaceae bacterium]|nr:HTTM domain-containing protein [Kofleriaceae bacterium]